MGGHDTMGGIHVCSGTALPISGPAACLGLPWMLLPTQGSLSDTFFLTLCLVRLPTLSRAAAVFVPVPSLIPPVH